MFVKILLIIIFIAIAVGVGIYTRRAASRDVDGFILGGRNVGPWLSAFAYGTAYFSAVVFIGYAGQFGWKYGMAATWAGIGNAVIGSLLAWWVLGPRTREVTQRLKASTMPEFFRQALQEQGVAHCLRCHHLRLPHPLYRLRSTMACHVCSRWRLACPTSGASSAWPS